MKNDKKKNEIEWYNNPDIITTVIIGLIALIVILSQSFAINNNLSAIDILSNILNHNIVYLLVFVYFVALKTKFGKKYFDFLNIFMILLNGLTTITSLLTVFQSFGLGSLVGLAIDLLILVYFTHTFLRNTIVWKNTSLHKSPFNEISNDGYFYSILVLAIVLLAVNLISTTSFDGTILELMDMVYTLLFIRYIFLYSKFLDNKKISVNNDGNFDNYCEMIADSVSGFVDKYELDDKLGAAKEKFTEITGDVKEKVVDIKENIEEKIENANLDEKINEAKESAKDFISEVKEEFGDIKEEIGKKLEDYDIDKRITTVKTKVSEIIEDVKEKGNKPKNIEIGVNKKSNARKKNTKYIKEKK